MKKYEVHTVYRGQQIKKMVCAKNIEIAAKLLEVSKHYLNTYGFKNKINNPFDGIMAYYDSGFLWRIERNLIRKEMNYETLKAIIDYYKDKELP